MKTLDLLFRDYEVQIEALRQRDYEASSQEQRLLEQSRIVVADRLSAQLGAYLAVHSVTGGVWRGTLANLGLGWLQLDTDSGELLIPLHQVVWWEGGSYRAAQDAGSVARKLSFGAALRAVAAGLRDVQILHIGADGVMSEGRICGVGADYCELKVAGSTTPQGAGRVRSLPFTAIAAVRVLGGVRERATPHHPKSQSR